MSIAFYMDHHVPRAITEGLRIRGIDVLTAHEDGGSRFHDPQLLDRATELERVLFTRDSDFFMEAAKRIENGIFFSGLVYAHQLQVAIGKCVQDLELIAKACNREELQNQVYFLPLA